MSEPVIQASEIGSYLFCQRAWWYQRQNAPSANVEELARGSRAHAHHWRGFRISVWARNLAVALAALALLLLLVRLVS